MVLYLFTVVKGLRLTVCWQSSWRHAEQIFFGKIMILRRENSAKLKCRHEFCQLLCAANQYAQKRKNFRKVNTREKPKLHCNAVLRTQSTVAHNVSLAELVAARAAELLPQDNDFAKRKLSQTKMPS